MSLPRWSRFWRAFDQARIVPRLCLLCCGWMTWHVTDWFMGLKEPNLAQGAFPSVVYGVIPLILSFYMQNGTRWDAPPATVTTATATTTTKASPASEA